MISIKTIVGTTTLGTAMLVGGQVASANHVDFLVDGPFSLTASQSDPVASLTQTSPEVDGDNVLGGQRDVTLTWTSGGPLSVRADLVTDALFFSADATEEGTLDLAYGGGGDLNSNFASQWSNLTVLITGDNDANLTATVNGSSVSKTFNEGDSSVVFNFGEFGGVDFTDVDTVSLSIDGFSNGDYVISSFERRGQPGQIIPSPAAAGAGALGLFALAFRRRNNA